MQNPADLPSRECSVKTLKKVLWWEGPSWLKNSTEDWPNSELFPDMEGINSEKKTIITAAATQREEKYYLRFLSYDTNEGSHLPIDIIDPELSKPQRAATSSMQPCSSVSDGEAGVELRLETLELPDDLTSDGEFQLPGPR
ncbi:hypothetical protein TNIN_299821 [Trichonephila inaurata madagascariensis]|uniref:Uncharacterized protein n=1 Tax=Trichonephila inaurata madagascariensis TaxID=2747483 RepID=A0A8X6WM09_9ARAC|nr:hypothetical protein TNIN_299821 [Trichonephila inaurata madagascariensis]